MTEIVLLEEIAEDQLSGRLPGTKWYISLPDSSGLRADSYRISMTVMEAFRNGLQINAIALERTGAYGLVDELKKYGSAGDFYGIIDLQVVDTHSFVLYVSEGYVLNAGSRLRKDIEDFIYNFWFRQDYERKEVEFPSRPGSREAEEVQKENSENETDEGSEPMYEAFLSVIVRVSVAFAIVAYLFFVLHIHNSTVQAAIVGVPCFIGVVLWGRVHKHRLNKDTET